mgnify:FL=1
MKKPYHLALILIFVQFIIFQAKAQDWQFAIGAGGWVTDNSSCSTIDSEGNVYFGGYITNGEFGDIPVPSQGVFLVKTDSNGNVIWVRTSSGGNAFRQTTGIATDSEDNIYVIGLFSSNMYFEDIFLDGTGLPRLFLAKYTNQGDVLWAKAFNPVNTGFSSGMDVVVDHDDFVYITGHFEDTLIFDSDTLINTNQSSTYTDIFLARLTPSGDAVWARSAGGNLDDYAYSIDLHKNGTLLIAGQVYSSNANFGNIQIDDDNPREKSYIVNYDNDGNVKWIYTSNQLFSTSSETTQITTDQKGNIYGFGNYFETIIFEDDTLHGSGNFIIKLDDLGNRVFSKSLST